MTTILTTKSTTRPFSQHESRKRRRLLGRRAGFWAVFASLSVLTAFSTAPSPLYGLYARQDGLASVTVTVVYGVYAVGIVTSLLLVGHVSDWYGRRTVLLPALLTALVGALVFTWSTSLPALLVGRVLSGVALGAAIATATAYLTDLDTDAGGRPTPRSQILATVANVGGLATGPLLAGILGEYVPSLPRLPYVVFVALLIAASVATAAAPEARSLPSPRPRYRPQRLAAPAQGRAQFMAALTGAFLVFTVFGVFAGLASAFLSGPLHRSSPALAGLTVFISYGIGAVTQVTTMTWPLRRLLSLAIPVLLLGLATTVAAAWVTPPSLALFLAGAALVGVGSGAIYRSVLTVVMSTAADDERAGALASFFVAGYVGLSVPVVAAGVGLLYVTFQVILLAFALAVAVGILLAAPLLLQLSDRGDS